MGFNKGGIVIIKELTPSEALERIKRDHIILDLNKQNDDGSIYKKIEFEEEFNIIESELKALEIIVKKGVDVNYIKYHCEDCADYNQNVANGINIDYLTLEEFDLLQEVLL